MYRFLATPRWLVAHVLVLLVAVTCVNFGLWQLRRLDERRALNEQVEAGLRAPPVPLAEALSESADTLAYRRVTASGRYLPAEEVLLSPRSRGGAPGHDVLTPLVTGNGGILVDRGWVPYELSDPPVAQAAPPAGEVIVHGFLVPTRAAMRAGPEGADRLRFVSDADVERLQAQVSVPLAPVALVLEAQEPAPGALPRPGAPPELSEGPHLSYAVQWFVFAAIALGGYPLLIRRRARELIAPPDGPPPSPPTGSATAPAPSRLPR
jgi:surfeit locus 1 family protein